MPIKEAERVNERWEDSFTFDIVVEHADSGLFQIGNEVISLNQTVDPFAGNEGLLLELIGVPNDAYQIDHTAWAGDMYEQNGILYRNAVAYGKKLVYDLEISYEDVITLPEEEGYQIRARYELLPKDASVMSESTSKSSGSNHWDWLKNLWEEMIKFLKKIAETVKKHPYITAVVFFLLFIIPCCQTQNKRCRRAGACFKAVASRSETRQKKVDLAACGVTAIRSFLKRRI